MGTRSKLFIVRVVLEILLFAWALYVISLGLHWVIYGYTP